MENTSCQCKNMEDTVCPAVTPHHVEHPTRRITDASRKKEHLADSAQRFIDRIQTENRNDEPAHDEVGKQ